MEDGLPQVTRTHRMLSRGLCIMAQIEQIAGVSGRWLALGHLTLAVSKLEPIPSPVVLVVVPPCVDGPGDGHESMM